MKRLFVALLVGAMVFGTVYALAETLIVQGGTIQAGADTDLACDEDGVAVLGWGLESDTGLVYSVRIGDIDEDCRSGDTDMFVNVTDGGTIVARGTVDNLSADTVTVNFATPYPAEDITDLEVFIEGTAND